nr:hypothetical protein [uncultured Cohaesibacter sp.]
MSISAAASLMALTSPHVARNKTGVTSNVPASEFLAGAGKSAQNTGVSTELSGKKLDITGKAYLGMVWEQSDAFYQAWLDTQQRWLELEQLSLEANHTFIERTQAQSEHPDYQPFAQVIVQGRVVAEISNNGITFSDTSFPKALQDILAQETGEKQGPSYAQARAEQIASFLGGQVVKAETALSQEEFDRLERPTLFRKRIDYEGMKNDPMFLEHQKSIDKYNDLLEKRAAYVAQQTVRVDNSI